MLSVRLVDVFQMEVSYRIHFPLLFYFLFLILIKFCWGLCFTVQLSLLKHLQIHHVTAPWSFLPTLPFFPKVFCLSAIHHEQATLHFVPSLLHICQVLLISEILQCSTFSFGFSVIPFFFLLYALECIQLVPHFVMAYSKYRKWHLSKNLSVLQNTLPPRLGPSPLLASGPFISPILTSVSFFFYSILNPYQILLWLLSFCSCLSTDFFF